MKVDRADLRPGRHAVRRRERRRARRAAPERARARGGRRRQRRAHGDRSQLDRRQAPALEVDRQDRSLARRAALAVQPRGGGDGRVPERQGNAIAGGARGRQLPVLGGSAAPLRPRLRHAREERERPLSVGRRERPAQRSRRPGRRHQGAASAGRARRGACLVPAPGLHAGDRRSLDRDGLGRDGRRRAPVGRRERAGPGARPLRRLLRDVGRLEDERAGRRLRPRRSDQLRRLPGASLAGVLRLEPEPDVRPADERDARALLLARLRHEERTVAGGAGKPDRGRRDRRRPARRLERVAALRRPDVHVAEPAPDRPRSRFHRGERGLLAAAGARGDPAAQPGGGAGGHPELRRRGVGPRTQLRASPFAPRPSHRPGCATAAGSVERRVQARRGGRPARDLGRRSRAAGMVAADLELARRPRCDRRPRQGRPALPRRRRRTQRRRGRRLGSEARLPAAATDLDDPLSRVPGPVERPQAAGLQRGRPAARPGPRRAPRRQGRRALAGTLGRRRRVVTARRHAAVARRRRRGERLRVCGRQGAGRAHRSLVRDTRCGRRQRLRSPPGSTSRRT